MPAICAQDRRCFQQLKHGLAQSKSDRAAALITLQNAYREHPDPRLCYNPGRLLHQLNRPAEALAQYRVFLESGVEKRPEMIIKARTFLEQLEREAAAPRAASAPKEAELSVAIARESQKPDSPPPIVPEPLTPAPSALAQAPAVQVKERPLYGLAARRPDVTDTAIVRPYGGQARFRSALISL